ncbi:carbohydrate ABC transporter permease [Cohnella lupini]|uniref:Carbohydrate ABC transporter membrane protein 2 (CUT1 family) n=1 Tax=Cohnella lupini TaxID=1294267 RepID=A0A3D9IS84_9BACL|nr:carbohydrate ABC transporter permease [Cohnella lupini]RED63976.1 carbohydrate ABC transporter membrane protein 2 (CUT1 family) [Cohnella lupini]
MYHKTAPYRVFNIFNTCLLLLIAILCIVPLVHVLAVSLSAKSAADANLVGLWPVEFSTIAYEKTISNSVFLSSLWIAAKRTITGTLAILLVACLAAYALSKENIQFKGRSVYAWLFIFTMVFNGGLIPFYIVIQRLGLMDSFWVLILPGIVNVWLTILLMNFFRGIPKELEEAALIDGSGHFGILIRIYLPLSLPALATLGLFAMVWHWNSWFDGLLYLSKKEDYPLATYLQTVIISRDMSSMSFSRTEFDLLSQKTLNAAQIFIGALPVLIVYPFLQKFFVKGLVMGSVKE